MSSTRTPNVIYEAVRNRPNKMMFAVNRIEVPPPFSFNASNPDRNSLAEHIALLRESEFDGYYVEPDGSRVLVKWNPVGKKEHQLNPIPPHEAEVQALRYLQGMLLIAEHTDPTFTKSKSNLMANISMIHQAYEARKERFGTSADLTLWLSDEYAKCLVTHLGIKADKATKQLTMARDLAIMMDQHQPAVCTISEESDRVTIEKSTPYKVSADYYNDTELFGDIPNQHWFKHAKKTAGLPASEKTWLDHFFSDETTLNAWKANRIATPPSARWLPLPPNNQRVSIAVATRQDNVAAMQFTETEFMRTGVLTPYDIKKIPGVKDARSEQKKVAKKILRELIVSQLDERIKKHKALYGDLIGTNEFDFYVSYQTLLSPLIGEERFPHTNNNARFITMVKEVVGELMSDDMFLQDYKNRHNVNLHIHHTNSAVNRNAHLSNEFSEDDEVRWEKIRAFEMYKQKVVDLVLPPDSIPSEAVRLRDLQGLMSDAGYSKALIADLVLREAACENMAKLLRNEPPFKDLSRYQRNIMLAALEQHSVGSQGYTMAGCKSARDRTGVFACAVKVMQENPEAMHDWKQLEKGIVKSLRQGHAFRSMIYHSAIIKVSLVHKRFMKALPTGMQKKINGLLQFAQKPPKYTEIKKLAVAKVREVEISRKSRQMAKALPPLPGKRREMSTEEIAADLLSQVGTISLDSGIAAWDRLRNTILPEASKTVSESLLSLREAHLNSKSQLMTLSNGKRVRVYPPREKNVVAHPDDFLASGIDSARGALAILDHIVLLPDIDKKARADLASAYNLFQERIHKIAFDLQATDEVKLEMLQRAQVEYQRFNGVLASILVEANCYPNAKVAMQGVEQARDMLWTLDRRNEAVCTVRTGSSGEVSALSMAWRVSFATDEMHGYEHQTWFDQLDSHHPWARSFLHDNPAVLTLSSTPMQRGLPNPANAWDESTVLVAGGKVKQVIHGVRSGISAPYQVKSREERQRLTNQNHFQFATDDRLKQYAQQHVRQWKGLLPGNEIVIPILHQTLVDPGSLRYLGNRSARNPRKFIKHKRIANEELQRYLAKKKVYCHPESGDILIDPKSIPVGYLAVKFVVKQTNNGVNVFEKVTDKTTRDVRDAEDLIYLAKDKLRQCMFCCRDQMQGSKSIYDEFSKVLGYLESSKPDHPRPMTQEEQSALNTLVQNLRENKYQNTGIDPATMNNLALLISAATNLASFMSYKPSGNVIGMVRDGVAMIHSVFKPEDMNDAVYKSCYERILAELLGVKISGCKSALDREQEVAELTNAMYRQFQAEGKIVGYHDTPEEKQHFLSDYVNTQHKHNMCEMITGTFGSSDMETQGQAYHRESDYEQQVSRLFNDTCRHIQAEACDLAQYREKSQASPRSVHSLFTHSPITPGSAVQGPLKPRNPLSSN